MKTVCRKCGSVNIIYSKRLHHGPIQGDTHHILVTCLNCKYSFNITRTEELLKELENQPWEMSKKTIKGLDNEKNKLTRLSLF